MLFILCLFVAAASADGPRRAPTLDLALRRVHRRAAEAAHTLALARAIDFATAYERDATLPRDADELVQHARALRSELADECRAAVADDQCLVARWDDEYDACFVSRACGASEARTRVPCSDAALDAALAQAALLADESPFSDTLAERRCAASAISSVGFLAHFDARTATCGQIDLGASDECRARFAAHPLAHRAPWLAALRELQQ